MIHGETHLLTLPRQASIAAVATSWRIRGILPWVLVPGLLRDVCSLCHKTKKMKITYWPADKHEVNFRFFRAVLSNAVVDILLRTTVLASRSNEETFFHLSLPLAISKEERVSFNWFHFWFAGLIQLNWARVISSVETFPPTEVDSDNRLRPCIGKVQQG